MTITLAGTLPVSAINVGLAASIGGLTAEVSKLQAELGELTAALSAKVQVTADFPPNPLSIAPALGAQLSAAEIAAQFNPANFVVTGADAKADLLVRLGAIEAELGVVAPLVAELEAGLDAGAVAGWSYAGRADAFGIELERDTARGFGHFAPTDEIAGLIVATEDLASWRAFGSGVNVGSSAAAGATSAEHHLKFLGELAGGQWNTGVAGLFARLDLLLAELRGAKSSLEASIQVSLGLNLPDATAQFDAGLAIVADLGLDGLLDNLVNAQADVTGALGGLQARIDATLALIAELNAQLSAGGLALWTYSGRAAELGSSLRDAIAAGVPGGHGPRSAAYGLALAGTAASMTVLGAILKNS